MAQTYFLVEGIEKVGADQVVKGQFIVDGTITVNAAQGAAKARPKPKLIKPFEVKWIVGPSGLGKEFAEGMGYETVAWDDFSYPPPRV
jgi:hypothetical protein